MCKRNIDVYNLAKAINIDSLELFSDAYQLRCEMDEFNDVSKDDWIFIFMCAKQAFLNDGYRSDELCCYIHALCKILYEDKEYTIDELKTMHCDELEDLIKENI